MRDELVVHLKELPEEGRQVNAVFQVVVDNGDLNTINHDETETEDRLEEAQDRFDSLSERL